MQFKTLISTVALTAAMTFSGAAFAQDATVEVEADAMASETVIYGGVEVSADDLGALQERCTDLGTTAATESLIEDDSDGDDEGSMDEATTTAGDANATLDDVPDVNEVANATTTLDLDTVTLEGCIEAGLTGEATIAQ